MILFHLPQKPVGSLYLGLSWELKFPFSRFYCFFWIGKNFVDPSLGKAIMGGVSNGLASN